MDTDLDRMSREDLVAEVRKLREGIRKHRDSTKHELCWHHPQLWGLLPEKIDPEIAVPAWPQFLRGCLRYRESLDEQRPDAPALTRRQDRDALGSERPECRDGRQVADPVQREADGGARGGEQLPGHGTVYLGQTLKFMAPVRPGDMVRVDVTVLAIDHARRRVTLETVARVGETVVLKGEALVLAPSAKFD